MVTHQNRPKRRYELKRRADDMAETRRRITEAAVGLHGTVGPARTTVTAVAERAGVQRHTVYRHFPTDADLFEACSMHFFHANPQPDLQTWEVIGEPGPRLERALDELYAYYERTESMYSNVYRDAEFVAAIPAALAPFERYLDEAARILAAGRPARGRRRQVLAGALRHAIDFRTWHSLVAGGHLTRAEAIRLMTALVEAAAAPRAATPA